MKIGNEYGTKARQRSGFSLTFGIAWKAIAFALFMGFAGFLPSLRASRLNIVEALRAR